MTVQVRARAALPTRHGNFDLTCFTVGPSPTEHLAMVLGSLAGTPLVRVHSECLTGDVLGSLRCDCGEQLETSLALIGREGAGVVVYLRGQEGRGIGLSAKLRAYALQEKGLDTVQANLALGLPVDARDYGPAAAFLTHEGVTEVRLLTNNPDKVAALTAAGVGCATVVPMPATVGPHSRRYLLTKSQSMGQSGLFHPGATGAAAR